MIKFIYTFLLYPLMYLGFFILAFADKKISHGFNLRKDKSWLNTTRPDGKLIWFHVASGEFEYAKPVIRELKTKSKCKILVTYFSPSILNALKSNPDVDVFLPMPWDTPWHWREFLNHYKPDCLAIARTDTWPQMLWQCDNHKVPSILFAATLPNQSGRVASFWGRILYSNIIEKISHISCVTEEDKRNFEILGHKSISVDGDTRYDQVLYRLNQNKTLPKFLENISNLFVAGSTWPEDEAVIIPSLTKPIKMGLTCLIAPHEPDEGHIKPIEILCDQHQISHERLSLMEASTISEEILKNKSVIIIDRVGILADLYKKADTAFVGGSFKKSVHSVMEPLGAGCVTMFGPYHTNSREALLFKSKYLAHEVQSKNDVEEFLLKQLSLSNESKIENKNIIKSTIQKLTGSSVIVSNWIVKNQKP